jgi:hypothetical protein
MEEVENKIIIKKLNQIILFIKLLFILMITIPLAILLPGFTIPFIIFGSLIVLFVGVLSALKTKASANEDSPAKA